MKPYVDTNFLCRTYLEFDETPAAERLVMQAQAEGSPPLPVTWLTQMELTNAFPRYVFAAKSGGSPRISQEAALAAYAQFQEDLHDGMLRSREVEVDQLQPLFEAVALRHTVKHGFRTYDLVHVCSALILGCDHFWSFDASARKLARLEGLKTN